MTTKALNPPDLRVRVLRAKFCIAGKPVTVDEIVTLPHHEALRLMAAGHVERV